MALSSRQRQFLKGKGHHLKVVVQVGAGGITPGVVAAASQALKDHELIKVKLAGDRDERQALIEALVEGTQAELAQVLGRTALLFKKRKTKSKFNEVDALKDEPS